ncbi:MAG: hypothetical protein FWB91_02090 [Defluviitaleaceae bacterium]|nr:hypothetical protein [Defluviitaleaceae bacterium]
MMEMMRRFGNNPANPKKVQISFMAVIGMLEFLNMLDTSTITSDEKEAYKFILCELEGKKSKVVIRQAYTAIVHAQGAEDKHAAYENYLATKELHT